VVIFGAAILIALNAVQTAALYAARRPIAGQICELIARNLAVVTLASSVVLITGGDLSARAAIAVFATASALALAISIGTRRALLSGLPEGHDSTKQTAASTSGRYRAVIALSAAAGIQMLATQVDLLALGFLRPIEETGYYRLAAQLAGLAAVPLAAATTYAEPRFSKWLHGGNTTAAVMLLKRGATALAAVSGAIAVMVVTFGADLVFFLFGPAYAPAAEPLGLLAVNAWAACSFGLVMTLAMSAGLERKLASAAAIALAANVVLSLIAIPHFAMQGAAAATLASTVLLRILAFRLITREMGKS
ncbi:MAG: polysaccharide biosynthesis C-terminal domain-containing protein, partial [Pseudomonadota bacterium]